MAVEVVDMQSHLPGPNSYNHITSCPFHLYKVEPMANECGTILLVCRQALNDKTKRAIRRD